MWNGADQTRSVLMGIKKDTCELILCSKLYSGIKIHTYKLMALPPTLSGY